MSTINGKVATYFFSWDWKNNFEIDCFTGPEGEDFLLDGRNGYPKEPNNPIQIHSNGTTARIYRGRNQWVPLWDFLSKARIYKAGELTIVIGCGCEEDNCNTTDTLVVYSQDRGAIENAFYKTIRVVGEQMAEHGFEEARWWAINGLVDLLLVKDDKIEDQSLPGAKNE